MQPRDNQAMKSLDSGFRRNDDRFRGSHKYTLDDTVGAGAPGGGPSLSTQNPCAAHGVDHGRLAHEKLPH